MRAASLVWQGKQQTVVAGGKASSGSITKVAGCLLFLSACEASERQTVVAGGMVRPLAVEASGGGIPTAVGCPARAKDGQASGGSTTVPLPARIFTLSICGTDRCPGIMCPDSRCPSAPLKEVKRE